ncbi:DUF554 family protein, partial [Escherichia coli]|uniref:DUF554 family protein n=2 Tax=Enterobacterales TaxID=91347 RepID=UPI0021B40BB0
MVIGPFINASAVLLGGVLGALLSQRLPERIRVSMTSIFGLASLGIGILLVVKCANLPAMVLATLLGALIGEICLLEKGVNTAVTKPPSMPLMRHILVTISELLYMCIYVVMTKIGQVKNLQA